MANGGPGVVIVESGGLPVTQVNGGGNASPFTVVTGNGFPVTLVDTLGIAVALYNLDGTEYSGFSLTAPVLTWTSASDDTTPEFVADLTLPEVDDVITLQWASDSGFTSIIDTSDNTVDAGEEAALLVNFVTGALSDAVYYFRAKHSRGASVSAWSNTETVTILTADVTAPVLSSPVDTAGATSTTGSGSVSTDEGNGTLYWVVSTSASAPSKAQVKAGQMHTGAAATDSGSQAVSGTGVQSITGDFTGLTAETAYTAHYMHEDAEGNQSDVSSADGFTTIAWTPAEITGAIWFDGSDTAKIFSDAGTTPITNGGSVQQWNGKGSNGSGLNVSEATNKPTWNSAGYLTFDGTNDVLTAASAAISGGLYAAGACSVFALVKGNPGTDRRLVAEGRSSDATPFWCILGSNASTATTLGIGIRNDASGAVASSATVWKTGFWDNTKQIRGCIDNGTVMTPYLAGTAQSTTAYTRAGSLTVDRFAIGGLVRTSASSFFAMDLYQLVIVPSVLSGGDITKLVAFLGTK